MNLSPLAVQKFFSTAGSSLVGGKLYTYVAGTSSPIATYTDSGGSNINSNPVILNSRGEANVWLDPNLTYKFVLHSEFDVPIWTVDNISVPLSAADLPSMLTQPLIGRILWPQSAAEIAASVVPRNYAYPWGNVLRYGAIADSTQTADGTDCTQAFQDACAQCVQSSAGAAAVLVPEAPNGFGYLCATPVFPPNGVTIEGTGSQSRLFTSLTTPTNIFRTGNSLGIGAGSSNITLRRLHFDGRRKSPKIVVPVPRSRLHALVLMGTDPTKSAVWSTNFLIEDCDFTAAIQNHLSFESIDGVRVVNVRVSGNGRDGKGGTISETSTACTSRTAATSRSMAGGSIRAMIWSESLPMPAHWATATRAGSQMSSELRSWQTVSL